MITWDQMAELLARMAVHDFRMGGKLDITVWLEVAEDQGWKYEAVRRVIRQHYGSGEERPRLTPAMVTDRLRAIRAKAAETFEPPRLPDGEDYSPYRNYAEWYRAQLRTHVDRELTRWAETGQEPQAPAVESGPAILGEVLDLAPDRQRRAIGAAAERMMRREIPGPDADESAS